MKRSGAVPWAGGVLLLALSGLFAAAGASAAAGPTETGAGAARAQALERRIENLERDSRRLEESRVEAERVAGREALAELGRLRADLGSWLARSGREPYRRNLDRFLRELERRLGRLSAEIEAPALRTPGEVGSGGKLPPSGRAGAPSPAGGMSPPPNDDCAAATVIGNGSFAGDTSAATVDGEAGCGASVVGPDVWFRYVAPASGEVIFNTLGSSFDTILSLHSACPGTPDNQLECNDDAVGTQSELSHALDAGEEVLVRIGGFAGDYGTLLLNVDRPAEIVGTVTDAGSGLGVAGVDVDFYDDNGYWRGDVASSASGAFSIAGLRQGTYYLRASHPGYWSELWDEIGCVGGCDPTTGTPITLALGEVARVDFALDRAGRIEGTVTDAQSGAPLEGMRVELFDDQQHYLGSEYTDTGGDYAFFGLPPDSYFVLTDSSEGYLGELFDDIPCPDDCDPATGTPIVVGAGDTVRADFALDRGGSIAGRVADAATGRPIADAYVVVYNQQGSYLREGRADLSGRYAVSGLTTGTYFALAGSYHYLDQLYDGIACPSGCDATTGTPIAVTLGGETAGIDFALLREAAFSGLVVDDISGVSAADVGVDAWDDQGDWVGHGWSDPWGIYTVGGLAAGAYFATTDNDSGYLDELYDDLPCVYGECDPTAGTPIAVAASMTTTGIDFALPYGGSISGRVTEAARGAVLGGRVLIWDSDGDERAYTYLENGEYRWVGLATGLFFVSTDLSSWYGYTNELYDDIPCPSGCDPTTGTPVAVTAGVETGAIDFALCGRPDLQAYFPPSHHPDSFIDGCRVQVGGQALPYHASCPPVARVHWEWGDGKQGDADLPAAHVYEPGHEWVTSSAIAFDAAGLDSPRVEKELHLWDCLVPGACGHPEERQLYNLVFNTTELIQACSTIALGPGLTIVEPGDVTLRAGQTVALDDGVRIEGGRLEIGNDPTPP